jgi:taurine dioxygenase
MAAVIEPKVTQSSALTLSPLTPGMGMEVGGVDLSRPLDEAMFAAVYDALYRHKLLVFRDQHALTDESYVAFGRRFGDLEVEPWRDTVPGLPIFISAGYGVERSIETWHVDLPHGPTWRRFTTTSPTRCSASSPA